MDLSLTEAERDLVELRRDFAPDEIAKRTPLACDGVQEWEALDPKPRITRDHEPCTVLVGTNRHG